MIRLLPFAIELILLVWCLIEAIVTPEEQVRNLPKAVWILLIVLLPIIGAVAWLVAGRPTGRRYQGWAAGGGFPERTRPRPAAPDDDPAYLASLDADAENRRLLAEWERDLRTREERLRRSAGDETGRADGAPA